VLLGHGPTNGPFARGLCVAPPWYAALSGIKDLPSTTVFPLVRLIHNDIVAPSIDYVRALLAKPGTKTWNSWAKRVARNSTRLELDVKTSRAEFYFLCG
jgi:hypothetical protein